jgi:hydroxypyruvate isomerase
MMFLDVPVTERVQQIAEAGFDVEIWDWTRHDVEALAATGATFSSMTGYVRGDFGDGADELVRTARESIAVAETLGCPRLNLHGTGLDDKGLPVVPGAGMGYAGTVGLEAWAADGDTERALARFRAAFTPA